MSTPPTYQPGTVRSLLLTDHVSSATRAALTERLESAKLPYTPQFFTEGEFTLLRAICNRLIGDDSFAESVDMARAIDTRLFSNEDDGWRFADFPNDRDAYRQAITALGDEADRRFATPFIRLAGQEQDAILAAMQTGDVAVASWQSLSPSRFFTEMLTEITETFYAHPLAQEEIGYVGMADLPSWQAIGINRLDDREPRAVQDTNGNS